MLAWLALLSAATTAAGAESGRLDPDAHVRSIAAAEAAGAESRRLDPGAHVHSIAAAAAAAGWSAAPFKPAHGLSVAEFKARFLGVADDAVANMKPAASMGKESDLPPLPKSFDWRTSNASLSTCIGPIVNQSPNGTKCGSCWAVSAVETFGDRRCIAARQQPQADHEYERVELSALDLISCDRKCKDPLLHRECNMGCLGGYPELAWDFFTSDGVVSSTCMPYNLSKQMLCPLIECRPPLDKTHYKTKTHYHIGAWGIKRDLVDYGPVQATFTVYEDFMNYQSGVYKHVGGARLGLHAVKVVGYGTDANGTDYWVAYNSWGPSFGMNGTFRIAVGQCGFEQAVYAGKPCLPGEGYPCKVP